MQKLYLCVLSFLLVFQDPLFGQQMFWNDITEEDKAEAAGIADLFRERFEGAEGGRIADLLSSDKVFIGSATWLKSKELIKAVEVARDKYRFSDQQFTSYSFDEFLDNHIGNPLIEKSYQVFDNHSVLSHLTIQSADKSAECIIVVRRARDGSWGITGLIGLIAPGNYPPDVEVNSLQTARVSEAGISLLVPQGFKGPESFNGQSIFYYEGKSGRDAVIQVMMDQVQAKIYFYTYKFVEHNNQQFQLSDLVVRYTPRGILYEYQVTDMGGVINKGITTGIGRDGSVVVVQFYALMDAYKAMDNQVIYMMENIR